MAVPTNEEVAQVAGQYSLPPAVLMGLVAQEGGNPGLGLPAATLSAYNLSPADLSADPLLALSVVARTLSQSFASTGSWESALSQSLTGNPEAWQSATSSVGGQVLGILGQASITPSFGMSGYQPIDPGAFSRGSSAFAKHLEGLVGMGGIVSPQAVHNYRQSVASVAMPTGPKVTPGDMSQSSAYPAKSFSAHPFAASFMGNESETYGYQWQGTTERGNDYGMPQGTPLTAAETGEVVLIPWAGKLDVGVKVSDGPWKGWTIGYGHSHALAPGVSMGQTVKAGQPLAFSGGDPSDPLAGMSSGAHVELQLIDPSGQWHDPHPVLTTTETSAGIPSPAPGGQQPSAPAPPKQPEHPDPAQVGEFATQLQHHGIDPQTFVEQFGTLADRRRQLLQAQRTDVSDYATMNAAHQLAGQPVTAASITAHVRSQPHPTYPNVSVGDFHDTYNRAALYSMRDTGAMPSEAETARMVGLDHKAIEGYYQAPTRAAEAAPHGAAL